MRPISINRSVFFAVLVAVLVVPFSVASRADTFVLPGFDLLETLPGTTFGGVPFTGAPLGTFDFGGGPVGVGNTDTIVHRLDAAHAPSESISTELVALHLESAIPVDFGLGIGSYFITLQSERGGPVSAGRMTINFDPEGIPHGTFNSFFDVFFDVRLGALNGPIALSQDLTLTAQGGLWEHEPIPGEFLVDGANHLQNGNDITNDFQPIGSITHQHPTGATHVVQVTGGGNVVPEPGSFSLFGAGALGLIGLVSRRRHLRT